MYILPIFKKGTHPSLSEGGGSVVTNRVLRGVLQRIACQLTGNGEGGGELES